MGQTVETSFRLGPKHKPSVSSRSMNPFRRFGLRRLLCVSTGLRHLAQPFEDLRLLGKRSTSGIGFRRGRASRRASRHGNAKNEVEQNPKRGCRARFFRWKHDALSWTQCGRRQSRARIAEPINSVNLRVQLDSTDDEIKPPARRPQTTPYRTRLIATIEPL